MAHGGRRPGAGRKRVREVYASPVREAEQKISSLLPWLVDKMVELVEGVEIQEADRNGKTKVYTTAPDRQAAEYLMDRVMGKPTQPVDVYDTARRLAEERGLDPAKVVSIFDVLKKKRTG